MASDSLTVVVSTLNALFSREGLAPLDGVETRSDLMEALNQRAWDWCAVGEEVRSCVSSVVPAVDLTEWLTSVGERLAAERKALGERLVQTLVATGIPVIANDGLFQGVLPEVDSADCYSLNGRVYGFTCQGMVFLNTSSMNLEAPLHEYAHLWATALRVANPTEWEHVVQLMRGTSVWQELSDHYQGALSDDRLAEEVLATFSGRKGTEKLRTAGLSGWERVVSAIQSFWRGVCGLVGIHFSSAEQVADRILRDFVSEVNPESLLLHAEMKAQYSELNAPVRQLFIGEKGAAELDASTLFSARVDCLQAANRMEAAGREPKQIKLATGWERGVDGFWRYELPLAKVYDISFSKGVWAQGFKLEELLCAPELFDAYPALRSVPVSIERMRKASGRYNVDNGIEINLTTFKRYQELEGYSYKDKALLYLRRLLLHEVQHWIQREEGFARGGASEDLATMLAAKPLANLREQNKPLYWYRYYLFTTGSMTKLIMGMKQRAVIDVIREHIEEHPESVERNAQLQVVADHIESLSSEEYGVFKLQALDQKRTVQNINRVAGKKAHAMYNDLAGEVEARNVEGRSFLSAAQRKGSLATETMDTPADKQLLRFGGELPTKVAARGIKR